MCKQRSKNTRYLIATEFVRSFGQHDTCGVRSKLRLLELKFNDSAARLGRETRRADRAETMVDELRNELTCIEREQKVKDSQLRSLRENLQDSLGLTANTVKEEDNVDTIHDVMQNELEAMRESYELQIDDLKCQLKCVKV